MSRENHICGVSNSDNDIEGMLKMEYLNYITASWFNYWEIMRNVCGLESEIPTFKQWIDSAYQKGYYTLIRLALEIKLDEFLN